MYFPLGFSLLFAFLLLVNMAAGLGSAAVWGLLAKRTATLPAFVRAEIIFFLRLGPLAAAILLVFAFIVPAYLLHEPENSGEVVSLKLGFLAVVSGIAVVITLTRVVRGLLSTRRLAAAWKTDAQPLEVEGFELPVYRTQHRFPAAAVVGIFRPRIFVAGSTVDSLTSCELRAVLSHEVGHIRSRDNLKRLILRVCRDLLLVPIGSDLDKAWAENAEAAADEYVASQGRSMALDLASALVKLARLTAAKTTPPLALHAALLDGEADVTQRVRRLLELADESGPVIPRRTHYANAARLAAAAVMGLLVLHFVDRRLLLTTHEAIEHFVWIIR